MERKRVAPGPNPELAVSTGPARLGKLVQEAREAEGGTRIRLAGEINQLLIAMRSAGNEEVEARAVLRELELDSLSGLVDDQERTCRAEAVETLLACGFPHALRVDPLDLAALRREQANPRKSRKRRAALIMAGGFALIYALLGVTTGRWMEALELIGVFAAVASIFVFAIPERK